MCQRLLPFLVGSVLFFSYAGSASAAEETLDEALENPQLVQSVKTLGLVILSQGNASTAAADAAEIRRSFWAARPEAGLTAAEAEVALKGFDRDWEALARVVREREMRAIYFVGMDTVLLTRSLDWYFGAATPRGPVLIRMSVQYNDGRPMTLHGVRVWTAWDEVKAATAAIRLRAGAKVMTITANRPATQPGGRAGR